jgi:hypothetical protein
VWAPPTQASDSSRPAAVKPVRGPRKSTTDSGAGRGGRGARGGDLPTRSEKGWGEKEKENKEKEERAGTRFP